MLNNLKTATIGQSFAIGTLAVFLGFALSPCALSITLIRPDKQSDTNHPIAPSILEVVAPDVTFVEVQPPDRRHWTHITKNPNLKYIAFTANTGSERIFIQEIETDKVYEIQGIPLPYRPFSNLEWSGQRLMFDRRSQPHYGIHYEIDVTSKKLVAAYAFN